MYHRVKLTSPKAQARVARVRLPSERLPVGRRVIMKMTAVFLRVVSASEVEVDMRGKYGIGRITMSLYGIVCPSSSSDDSLERKLASLVARCLQDWLADFGITSGDEISLSLVGVSDANGFEGIIFSSPYSNVALNTVMVKHGVCKLAKEGKWEKSDSVAFMSHYVGR